MKTPLIEKLTEYRIESGLSYDKLGERTGISSSTICRWYKGQGVPSLDEIEMLCDAMGHDISDIFVTIGKQELTATQNIGYQGADAMVAHYEARLQGKDDQQKMLQEHHKQAIEHRDKVIDYLKKQVEIMQQDRVQTRSELDAERDRADAAEAHVKDMDRKRHNIFWIMGIICSCLSVGLVIALFSNSIL